MKRFKTERKLKYRFAFDAAGTILDVTKIESTQSRERPQGLRCIGCGQDMIVSLGNIRVHYFAHKRVGACSLETYRHVLAKNVFKLRYEEAVREKQPFFVELDRPLVCAHRCEYPDCPEKLGMRLEAHDLTRRYDTAAMERKVGPFIADVLLWTSGNPDDCLFIEMLVKHKSDEAKCKAVKMLEITVPDENRIDDFDLRRIRAETFTPYNLKRDIISPNQECACAERRRLEIEALRQRQEFEQQEAERLEEIKRLRAEAVAAMSMQERADAEKWKEEQRQLRQQRKLDQVSYVQWHQAQSVEKFEVRNMGELEKKSGPAVIVPHFQKLPRKPPTLAYILNNLNFNNSNQIWNDYERGIVIRRRQQSWKPYVVEVVGQRNFEFQGLDEAIAFYHATANIPQRPFPAR